MCPHDYFSIADPLKSHNLLGLIDTIDRHLSLVKSYYLTVRQKVLDEEKHVWRADIDTQARVLREDLEGYKLGVNAKMRDAWDALRAAGRRF